VKPAAILVTVLNRGKDKREFHPLIPRRAKETEGG